MVTCIEKSEKRVDPSVEAMPTGEERLAEISKEEHDVFVVEARELYVEVSDVLKVQPKMDSSVYPITRNTTVDRPVQNAITALKTDNIALLSARGNEVKKLVAIVERIKQRGPKDIKQFNKLTVLPSLINPGYASKHSVPNIQAFFGDPIEMQDKEKSVKKDIHGHKVYDLPCLSILLVRKAIEAPASKLSGWSAQ